MRVVAKIGTASITDEPGCIDGAAITKLCDEVAALRADGHEIIVVSSGAVAAGVLAVGLPSRPTDMATLQAISAAGQSRLVEAYNAALARHGLVGAQVLLDPHDFVDRTQYLHARRTLVRLLELGCVPVVNENDAIANHELRYGDNDRLAALVANSVGRRPPRTAHRHRRRLHRRPPPRPDGRAGRTGGGRRSAAGDRGRQRREWPGERRHGEQADRGADRVVVGHPQRDRPRRRAGRVGSAVSGAPGDAGESPVGTTFDAHDRTLPARKLWIAFAAEVEGDDRGRRGRRTGAHRAASESAAGGRGGRDRVVRGGRHRRHRRPVGSTVRSRHGGRRRPT